MKKWMWLSRPMRMFLIDIVLVIVFPLLYALLLTGLQLHELAGLFFFSLMIVHLHTSWSWILKAQKKWVAQKDWKPRVNFLLNAVLFMLIAGQIVSGLVISRFILSAFGISTINDYRWRSLHLECSRLSVLVISLHIALNWKRIVFYTRRKKGISAVELGQHSLLVSGKNLMLTSFFILLATLMIGGVIYMALGTPLATREMLVSASDRYHTLIMAGVVQYAGFAIVLAILVYASVRWLKLKL